MTCTDCDHRKAVYACIKVSSASVSTSCLSAHSQLSSTHYPFDISTWTIIAEAKVAAEADADSRAAAAEVKPVEVVLEEAGEAAWVAATLQALTRPPVRARRPVLHRADSSQAGAVEAERRLRARAPPARALRPEVGLPEALVVAEAVSREAVAGAGAL